MLSESREQFIKIGYRLGAAECLHALGDNNRFEGKYVEAEELLTQARDENSLNSVIICGRNVDNIVTLYCLRRPSGRSADYM